MPNPDLPNCVVVRVGSSPKLSDELREQLYDYSAADVEGLPDNYIVILSTEEEKLRDPVTMWLYENQVPFDELYMCGDTGELEAMEWKIKPRYNVVDILSTDTADDRDWFLKKMRARP